MKLSDRLRAIAGEIRKGERVADIGTDHGLLPVFLYRQKIAPKVILCDVNEGPLQKARENIEIYAPDSSFDLRLGDGLGPLACGEADAVVIAGMGGLLMIDILTADIVKTCSMKKFILQPRNAPEKLRRWLTQSGFTIVNEKLVREGKYICEIITVLTPESRNGYQGWQEEEAGFERREDEMAMLAYEISPLLFEKQDPLLENFLNNKIAIEEKIMRNIRENGDPAAHPKYQIAGKRREAFWELLESAGKNREREKVEHEHGFGETEEDTE